jgi:hypothetical protein
MTRAETTIATSTAAEPNHGEGFSKTKPRRRWFQISLRLLLLMPIGVAVFWYVTIRPFDIQQDVIVYVQQNGGIVATQAGGPKWLHLGGSSERFQDVVHVDLADAECSQECVDHILRLPRLKSLILGGESFRDEHLLQLQSLRALDYVILDTTSVTDRGIADLKVQLPTLLKVHRSIRQALEQISQHRGGLKTTRTPGNVGLRQRFGDDHFRDAGSYACFSDPGFDDDDMALMKHFPNVDFFGLYRSGVTDAGLRHLAQLPKLTNLHIQGPGEKQHVSFASTDELSRTQITSRALIHLGGLTNLEYVRLTRTQVDGADLLHLQALPKLKTLILTSTSVSDTDIEILSAMSQLEELDVVHTSVTADGVERLQKALPNCEITYLP